MGILAQCPVCKTRQSIKNKLCRMCGSDLNKAKSGKKLIYWISYRLPSGKQKQEPVGTSIEEARAAEGKKKAQKKEGKLFDIKADAKITFQELTDWYLKLEKVEALASYDTIRISLVKFNKVYGGTIIAQITPADLENYQAIRLKAGMAPATIDHEIGKTRTMISKAFDNRMISGETMRTFKVVKNVLKKGTFNTNMRKAGVPESVIMAITGHSTRQMFDRYNTIDLEDTRNAVNSLEVFFKNVTQNVTQTKKGT